MSFLWILCPSVKHLALRRRSFMSAVFRLAGINICVITETIEPRLYCEIPKVVLVTVKPVTRMASRPPWLPAIPNVSFLSAFANAQPMPLGWGEVTPHRCRAAQFTTHTADKCTFMEIILVHICQAFLAFRLYSTLHYVLGERLYHFCALAPSARVIF